VPGVLLFLSKTSVCKLEIIHGVTEGIREMDTMQRYISKEH
jgi:hypothetical protein